MSGLAGSEYWWLLLLFKLFGYFVWTLCACNPSFPILGDFLCFLSVDSIVADSC